MDKTINLDEHFFRSHITFTSVSLITEITKPLHQIGLSYFSFDRSYQNGNHIRLTNAGKWIESYYRQGLYKTAIFEKNPNLFCNGHILWLWLPRDPIYSSAAEYNIDHGITIIEKHKQYTDFFHFGATCENYICPEDLVEKLDCLYRFIAYFKQKTHKLILDAEKTQFYLPIPTHKNLCISHLNAQKDPTQLAEFFKKTEISRLYLGSEFNNTYLTRRELEILAKMQDGKKPVTIAKYLGISHRTLESHLKNIKEKLKCNTLFELGFVLGGLGLKNRYLHSPLKIDTFKITHSWMESTKQ